MQAVVIIFWHFSDSQVSAQIPPVVTDLHGNFKSIPPNLLIGKKCASKRILLKFQQGRCPGRWMSFFDLSSSNAQRLETNVSSQGHSSLCRMLVSWEYLGVTRRSLCERRTKATQELVVLGVVVLLDWKVWVSGTYNTRLHSLRVWYTTLMDGWIFCCASFLAYWTLLL